MTNVATPPTASAAAVESTESIKVPVWAWALLTFAVFTLYVVSQENGAILGAQAAELLHELTHDARHALGVPCH